MCADTRSRIKDIFESFRQANASGVIRNAATGFTVSRDMGALGIVRLVVTLVVEQRREFDTHLKAIVAVSRWIDQVYNRRRRYSSLGYLDPVTFERNMFDQAATEAA